MFNNFSSISNIFMQNKIQQVYLLTMIVNYKFDIVNFQILHHKSHYVTYD